MNVIRLQRNLRRSRAANRVGLALLVLLSAILVVALVQGVKTL